MQSPWPEQLFTDKHDGILQLAPVNPEKHLEFNLKVSLINTMTIFFSNSLKR